MTDDERGLDVQTSHHPKVIKARQRAQAALSPLVGSEGARTIAEAIGGPLGQYAGAVEAIAKIIDRALVAQQRRDRMFVLADEALQASITDLRSSRVVREPVEQGTLRGLAFKNAERAALFMEWAKEVGSL